MLISHFYVSGCFVKLKIGNVHPEIVDFNFVTSIGVLHVGYYKCPGTHLCPGLNASIVQLILHIW